MVVSDIGWHHDRRAVRGSGRQAHPSLFKLYPWEWLLAEEFGPHLIESLPEMQWMEPLWKLVLSNKGILPILWELYPGHPNLLAAWYRPTTGDWVKKPRFSREGANVAVHRAGGQSSGNPRHLRDRKVSFISNWRPCPTSTATIPSSAVGLSG